MIYNLRSGLKHLLLAIFLASGIVVDSHAKQSLDSIEIQSFLDLMIGDWKGQAVETPIGLRPYDINFSKNQLGHVKGQTGVNTIHYWDFSKTKEFLKLEFLTTFAGNKQPIIFKSRQYTNQGYIFNSINRDDVQVIIKPLKAAVTIRIRLNNKPHVKIQLTRQEN